MIEIEEMIAHAKLVVFRSDSGAAVRLVKVRKAFPTSATDREPPRDRWTIWIEGGSFVHHRRGEQAFFETFEEAYRAGMSMPYPAKQNRTFLLPKLKGHRPGGGVDFGFARRLCVAFLLLGLSVATGCVGAKPGANAGPALPGLWVSAGLLAALAACFGLATLMEWLAGSRDQPSAKHPKDCETCRRRYGGD